MFSFRFLFANLTSGWWAYSIGDILERNFFFRYTGIGRFLHWRNTEYCYWPCPNYFVLAATANAVKYQPSVQTWSRSIVYKKVKCLRLCLMSKIMESNNWYWWPVDTVGVSIFCTVNCRPSAGNYQLSHMRSGQDSNSDLSGGRRVSYHCVTMTPGCRIWDRSSAFVTGGSQTHTQRWPSLWLDVRPANQ